MDRGELVSDDVMIGIVTERLARPDAANGFVLDGFPRTVAQAEALDRLMAGRDPLIVLDIVVPESELARRLGSRMICEDCGHNADGKETDAGAAAACCGGKLTQRADDNARSCCERFKIYQRATQAAGGLLSRAADVPVDQRRADGWIAWRRIWRRRSRRSATAPNARAEASAVIVCRSAAELERMREAGRLVGEVLTELAAAVAPGVSTADLDELAEKRIRQAGATPAFKGYHGYPATICASINDEVIHGIPSGRRVLNEGDIISIDVGAALDGYFGDSAVTLPVGQISEQAATLLRVTEESLYKAIEAARPGKPRVGHRARRAEARRGVRVFGRARVRRPRHRRSGCTRSRRCRTTASRATGRGWPRAWCSRSSRW